MLNDYVSNNWPLTRCKHVYTIKSDRFKNVLPDTLLIYLKLLTAYQIVLKLAYLSYMCKYQRVCYIIRDHKCLIDLA